MNGPLSSGIVVLALTAGIALCVLVPNCNETHHAEMRAARAAWVSAGHCVVVERRVADRTHYDQTAYRCADGVLYWKDDVPE